jgi:uncharacterized protein
MSSGPLTLHKTVHPVFDCPRSEPEHPAATTTYSGSVHSSLRADYDRKAERSMSAETDAPTVEKLNETECRALLATQTVGRLAFIANDRATITPINYLLIDDLIAIRTDPGEKLTNTRLRQVCLEADGTDQNTGAVWSVVVQGTARDVTTALNERYEQLRHAHIPAVMSFSEPHWLAITIEEINGRRISRSSSGPADGDRPSGKARDGSTA